jgi:hypothetical protein
MECGCHAPAGCRPRWSKLQAVSMVSLRESWYNSFRGASCCLLQGSKTAVRRNEDQCHADPFGAAQGMLREASRRMTQ